jgi:hypothetical protein
MGFNSAFKGLKALNKNHHIPILGIKLIKHLLIKRLGHAAGGTVG